MPRKPNTSVAPVEDKDDHSDQDEVLDPNDDFEPDGPPEDPDDDPPDDPDDDDDDDPQNDPDDDDDDGGQPMPIAAVASAAEERNPATISADAPFAAEVSTSRTRRPPAPPRKTKPRGPHGMSAEARASSPALQAVRGFQESAYAEIDSLLASLNFASRQYEVRVSRIEPDYDENDVSCAGELADYKDKVTIGDIRRRFGGGLYTIKVFGPHPTTGRPGIIKQETFRIAGRPKPMKSQKNDDERAKEGSLSEALKVIAESNEKMQARIFEVVTRQSEGPSAVTELAPLIEKFLTKGEKEREDERKREEERRRDEREERKREEDRRRDEERQRREDEKIAREEERERRKEERERERREEDKKREEERERRKDEAAAAEEKRREERAALEEKRREEREFAKEERERLILEAKEAAAERQRQHERDMAAQAERMKQDQARQTEFMTMMQKFNDTQMEMLQSRQESGGIKAVTEQLLMLKNLQGTLTGSDEEPTTIEKFNEGLEGVVKTIMPVGREILGAIKDRRPVQGQPQGQQQQQPIGRPVVVDLGPHRPALPKPNPAAQAPVQGAPATAVAQPAAAGSTSSNAPVEDASAVPDGIQDIPNDHTEFHLPTEQDDMLSMGFMLLKNVDLAIQRNMSPEDIVDQVLDPFEEKAPVITSMAAGLQGEQLIEFISDNVPANWAILSPRGEAVVLKAFEIWSEDEDDEGVPQ